MKNNHLNSNYLKRFWLVLLIILFSAVVIILDLEKFYSFEVLKDNRELVLSWYDKHPSIVISIFFVLYVLVVVLSLPGAVWLSIVAGFLMGTWVATSLVVFAATLGALGIFFIARYLLTDFFRKKTGSFIRKMEAGFQENELSYILVLRLVPVFPFWLVNIVPALFGVSVRTFVVGTFIGIIPGTAVFCSIGNGLGALLDQGRMPVLDIIFEPKIIGPLLALAVLSLTPIVFKKLKKLKKR